MFANGRGRLGPRIAVTQAAIDPIRRQDPRRICAMTISNWLLIGVSALVLCACQDLNLDPESHRAFAKTNAGETAPPADLSRTATDAHYVASR